MSETLNINPPKPSVIEARSDQIEQVLRLRLDALSHIVIGYHEAADVLAWALDGERVSHTLGGLSRHPPYGNDVTALGGSRLAVQWSDCLTRPDRVRWSLVATNGVPADRRERWCGVLDDEGIRSLAVWLAEWVAVAEVYRARRIAKMRAKRQPKSGQGAQGYVNSSNPPTAAGRPQIYRSAGAAIPH